MNFCRVLSLGIAAGLAVSAAAAPSLDQALASKEDVWGLQAMRQTNGPTYDFFAGLLPPLRYVNARFREYPIVLSAPAAAAKARLISDGSAVNARAGLKTWKEPGAPVLFSVDTNGETFGSDPARVDGPHLQDGFLPIVNVKYKDKYREEAFGGVTRPDNGVVFVQFSLAHGGTGLVSARIDVPGPFHRGGSMIRDAAGRGLVAFDSRWRWDAASASLQAVLSGNDRAALAIPTVPCDAPKFSFDAERKKCANTWRAALQTRVETPEPLVNDAWKSVLIGSLMLQNGVKMNYSAGNAYQAMWEAECGDAVRGLMLWGLASDVRQLIPPLLHYGREPGLKFHDASFKLQLLASYYWLTRDAEFIRRQQPAWEQAVRLLTEDRDSATGLLPPENYCGDETEKVFTLNADANSWRGLRDMAVVLGQMGDSAEAGSIARTAETLRVATLAAVKKSEFPGAHPLFIPMALFGREKPYDTLTATRRGSYYDLMIPYVIGSGIFGRDSEEQGAMLDYLQEHGGLCMGLIRFNQHSGLYANDEGVDDLYTLRYDESLLQRDEVDRALAGFYGKLAQGMTRNTFISAEGTGLRPIDARGRPMYLPPNSAGNGYFLTLLRSMLVQDDADDDGVPRTLRLLFATPKPWLENGKEIKIDNAPTAFGEVSLRIQSRLKAGYVLADIRLPSRNQPVRTFLRIRLPEGWKIVSAKAGKQVLTTDNRGTVDISALRGRQTIRFAVAPL